jgi:hypothetical protein
MEGTWKRLEGSLKHPYRLGAISLDALHLLDYVEGCKLCYDPETPKSVIDALKYHPDRSVVSAAFQRPDVLSGKVLNPFRIKPQTITQGQP